MAELTLTAKQIKNAVHCDLGTWQAEVQHRLAAPQWPLPPRVWAPHPRSFPVQGNKSREMVGCGPSMAAPSRLAQNKDSGNCPENRPMKPVDYKLMPSTSYKPTELDQSCLGMATSLNIPMVPQTTIFVFPPLKSLSGIPNFIQDPPSPLQGPRPIERGCYVQRFASNQVIRCSQLCHSWPILSGQTYRPREGKSKRHHHNQRTHQKHHRWRPKVEQRSHRVIGGSKCYKCG